MVEVAGSALVTDVTGALVVAGAVLAGVAMLVCGTVDTVDVDGTGSTSIVSGGTVIDEHAASNISAASHVVQLRARRVAPVETRVLRPVPTVGGQHSAHGSRTRSKGLLLDMGSRAIAITPPAAEYPVACRI
ncbi:hypothetical protein [Candidatus Poriferisodalis sp.]|uniref:hypothetical protein n=1 Tax=Candidatus Poriferisodalis sp. TaxID=3101277 RepID=UPI003B52DEB3